MKIGALSGWNPAVNQVKKLETDKVSNFDNIFTGFVKQVNMEQSESRNMLQDFIEGKGVELHEVMIAGEKAKTSLELLMEIRNKSIDMYKELTRMQ
jgi:flagellar hook-basal body complex protein FliE